MTERPDIPKGPNPIQIDVKEEDEVRYWAQKFDVSEAALRQAVADVGVQAGDVAAHLGKPSSETRQLQQSA
ncbi:DUF3606 domain-containing protein [Variovorax sp. J22R133]|uniref:DUF3606 domain-containing protein n=1 Tax=Variovorax brevis TaxID=3053503 RepID=UPI002574AB03|nr:DUF3606 domain-containing protein [Variovorax sp. J22R133]MDM0110685.1 DUF3606 domain-containing protein [Variovorax sp. J22R133]